MSLSLVDAKEYIRMCMYMCIDRLIPPIIYHSGCSKQFHPSCALQHKAALANAELLAGELWDAEVRYPLYLAPSFLL